MAYRYFVETTSYDKLSKWSKILFDNFRDIRVFLTETEHDEAPHYYQLVVYSNWDCMQQLKKALDTEVFLYFEHH